MTCALWCISDPRRAARHARRYARITWGSPGISHPRKAGASRSGPLGSAPSLPLAARLPSQVCHARSALRGAEGLPFRKPVLLEFCFKDAHLSIESRRNQTLLQWNPTSRRKRLSFCISWRCKQTETPPQGLSKWGRSGAQGSLTVCPPGFGRVSGFVRRW
jgi:hypothetical protein